MLVGRSLFLNLEENTCGAFPTQGRNLYTLQGEIGHCLSCLTTFQGRPSCYICSQCYKLCSCASVWLCYLAYGKALEKYLLTVNLGQIQVAFQWIWFPNYPQFTGLFPSLMILLPNCLTTTSRYCLHYPFQKCLFFSVPTNSIRHARSV